MTTRKDAKEPCETKEKWNSPGIIVALLMLLVTVLFFLEPILAQVQAQGEAVAHHETRLNQLDRDRLDTNTTLARIEGTLDAIRSGLGIPKPKLPETGAIHHE